MVHGFSKFLNKKSDLSIKIKMNSLIFCGLILSLLFWSAVVLPPIELTTDKDVYKPGEEVNIRIKNISNKVLRGSITLTIKDEGGKVVDELVILLDWPSLKPGESIKHKWNQKGRVNGYGQVGEGKYIITAVGEGYKISREIEIKFS
jgi:hypothetical protein